MTISKLNINLIKYSQSLFIHMSEVKKYTEAFEKGRTGKSANLSQLEQQIGTALVEIINHLDAEGKRIAASVAVNRALEITYQKDKSFVLIYVSYKSHKVLLSNLYKKLVTELQKKLKKTVLILSNRKIHSRWVKQNRTQTRPNSRTLSSVYNAILDELLLPGIIIGHRTRVRLDGSQYSKVTLDKAEQHFLEERTEAIKAAYKRLTTRDIEIDFQKEATFYTLKKGEKK